jgi:ATP-dependent Lhr-like helicase
MITVTAHNDPPPASPPLPSSVDDFFDARGWTPFAYQRQTWDAYLRGESGLVEAATGTGKTLAVWSGAVQEWIDLYPHTLGEVGSGEAAGNNTASSGAAKGSVTAKDKSRTDAAPLQVLWITPMRALAADTLQALSAPVTALGLPWSIELRTGDTTATLRKKQREKLPTALIITPESLSLLLTYPETREQMQTLRAVIVDEWHELLGTRRGVQTELCLARLKAWIPDLRIWGLSATLGNLETARDVLLGNRPGTLISGAMRKQIEIETLLPEALDRFPWAGHLGLSAIPQVVKRLAQAQTTLLFTNTRNQAERWYQALTLYEPDWEPQIALHHGSLDRGERERVERDVALRRLRCVVCTSSLDLGVDFAPVDQVIQVGSPRGVARLLQRAGRSGHQPDGVSRIVCVPTNSLEMAEFAAVRDAVAAHEIEARQPLTDTLDVLVQHLVTVSIGGGFVPDAMRAEVMSAYAFANLTEAEWQWALEFITQGGALSAYPQFHRVRISDGRAVEVEAPLPEPLPAPAAPPAVSAESFGPPAPPAEPVDPPRPVPLEPRSPRRQAPAVGQAPEAVLPAGTYTIASREAARLHRMGIGTISSESGVRVVFLRGGDLGTVDENFLARLTPGDTFIFGGYTLELVLVKEMKAYVRKATRRSGVVPKWVGGRMPLSVPLAHRVRQKFAEAVDSAATDPEMKALAPLLDVQQRWSALPAADQVLIERMETRDGHHLFFYPFEGRAVHEGLAALIAYRLTQQEPRTITYSVTDYGFELLSADPWDGTLHPDSIDRLLSTENALSDLLACMNAAELVRRQFRQIARVAGLVTTGLPGASKTARQLQASSGLIYDVLLNYDPDNLLLQQARRETLTTQLESGRIEAALLRLSSARLLITGPDRLTPFAFPIWAERVQAQVSSEKWLDRVRKMAIQLESAAKPSPGRRPGRK